MSRGGMKTRRGGKGKVTSTKGKEGDGEARDGQRGEPNDSMGGPLRDGGRDVPDEDMAESRFVAV